MRSFHMKNAAVWLLALALCAQLLPGRAWAVTQDEINALKAKKEAIGQQMDEIQARLSGLQSEQTDVLGQRDALNAQKEGAEQEIALVEEEIALYDRLVAEKSAELDAARATEQRQLERFRSRVRAMEERGEYSVLSLVFEAENYAQLLTAIDDISMIMQSDRELADAYEAARREVERVKAEYEQALSEQKTRQTELEAEKAALLAKIAEAEATLEDLADEIAEAEAAYEAERQAEAEAARKITELIEQYEEEQRQKEAEERAKQQQSYNFNGAFGWPVPSKYLITGVYGEDRTSHFHAGIDIDGYGQDGSPIVASAAGTVILAEYYGGYGNCVIIDHGNGYTTLYGHMSGFAVSVGDSVGAGQTIGYLGSTGNSTGTHCHFEIRINGATVDPEAWFPGVPHYNC